MEDIDIEQIKASLLEEQRLETKLKKQPEVSDDLLPLLHSLYIARMNLERANWGCSVDRNRFSLLKSSLLEEAHLEELLKQEGNNGTDEKYNLDAVVPVSIPLKPESSLDSDLQKLLRIARNKSSIYKSELEANLDLTAACPLLPTGETPKTIATQVTQKTRNYLNKKADNITLQKAAEVTKEPKNATTKQDTLKEKEKRRQLVRYIMSSVK